jgi:hypothetical protein
MLSFSAARGFHARIGVANVNQAALLLAIIGGGDIRSIRWVSRPGRRAVRRRPRGRQRIPGSSG